MRPRIPLPPGPRLAPHRGWAPAVVLLLVVGLVCGLVGATAARAQGGGTLDGADAVVSSNLVGLETAPRYHWRPGDGYAAAAPELDVSEPRGGASAWRVADADTFPAEDWRGIGWFRFRVTVADHLHDVPVGVDVRQVGAAEIYVDGELVHSWGQVGISPADDVPDRTGDPRPLVFRAEQGHAVGPSGREHLVAVRYSSRFLDEVRWRGVEPDLAVLFLALRPAVEERLELVHKLSRHQMFLAGVSLAFGLVHLLLFVFRPRIGPNVFFALLALTASAHVYLNFGRFVQKDPLAYHTLQFYQLLSFLALGLAALRFVYSVLYARCPRTFLLFAAAALPLGVWVAVTPFLAEPWCYVFLLAVNLEIVRATLVCWWTGRKPLIRGAWVLGLGATPLVVLSIYQLLAGLELLPSLWNFIDFPAPYYGLVILMFSMSIYLGRDFALTQSRLERELARVQRLSEEKLAQEQLAREKEVERARLEAENSRRAAELEEARRIQMSMLPREIPTPPGLELAVHLETATEVGGDYYDFLASGPDDDAGEFTVVVGDATGHGAQAGTVVAVTKGILRSGDDPSPRQCLERISQGLRQIGLRRRHMALVAARFAADGRRVLLSAAAMPPVLLYRPGQGDAPAQVASIEFQSLPLGSLASDRYEEKDLELRPGDRLVFFSDGLPEARDDEGRPVGYPRVEGAVLEHGHRAPHELIEALLQLSRRDDVRPDDDLTLLVVAVESSEDGRGRTKRSRRRPAGRSV